jgi:hypothetical protein
MWGVKLDYKSESGMIIVVNLEASDAHKAHRQNGLQSPCMPLSSEHCQGVYTGIEFRLYRNDWGMLELGNNQ